ncbi:MAG: ABC-F family ATP-binding cassette domain-containing protein, partial [Chitinophagaceae bacterium]
LNLVNGVFELSKQGINFYGGNYELYTAQKQIEKEALHNDLLHTEKTLRKARIKERETAERQQKLDARGKNKQEKAGVAKIMMNTLRNNAEKSTSKTKAVHEEKIAGISKELQALRSAMPGADTIKLSFDDAGLHKGKKLFTADNINMNFGGSLLWKNSLSFELNSGERVALKGLNGSGKTTLIKIILAMLEPSVGKVYRAVNSSVYIDQDYSLIQNQLTVFEQAQVFNKSMLQEHEIKIRLNRFLFGKDVWDKSCAVLSGGEKMRLMLCCLHIANKAPDIIILDEPTNNLDIQNIEILRHAISEYNGTLMVVSHDGWFLEQVNVKRWIEV